MYLKLTVYSLCLTLFGCTSLPGSKQSTNFPRFHDKPVEKLVLDLAPLPLSERLAYPSEQPQLPEKTKEKVYSFVAKDMPLEKAVELFSKAYQLNILTDKDVSGKINIEFHNLPFEQAMQALLGSLGYYWKIDNNLIRIRSWETRTFSIDYIRLNRIGRSTSEAQVSSGSSSSGGSDSGGSGSNNQAGKITIEQENRVEFWGELEKQLKVLISAEGRLVINNIAGTVQVTDRHPRVEEMAQYIADINDSVHRQVNIQVKILEVTLNDDFSLGVDWSRLVSPGQTGTLVDFNISNIITAPIGVGSALNPALSLSTLQLGGNGENKLSAVLDALREQGELQIVSQPHIRTMNNQSALIKVGTDRTFFRREQNTDNTTAGSNTTTTDVPQVVTEGIVLSITPQISKDGWIMMDISPVVTRVSSVSEVRDAEGRVVSSAPNLDIRQTSSLIRAFNGETVIIGGLIQTQESNTNRGIPGLQDIVGIGKLFEGNYKSTVKKELIMFLTPELIESTHSLTE